MKKTIEFIRKNRIWIILALILGIGMLLRSYNFENWIRYNNDQVRDSIVVDDMISGEEFPLLGPKAGGTGFKLGPAFYYVEYVFALIFGNSIVSLALPSLVFSLASILLLFFFFKKYFTVNISLALSFLYAISFFAIKYSRFEWNPNLMPFFIILFLYSGFSFLISGKNDKKEIYWAIVLAIAIGIGVQLHTLLLVIFPIMLAFIIGYRLKNKTINPKNLVFIFSIIFALNLPLIINEFTPKTESNFAAFFSGADEKVDESKGFLENVKKDIECHAQSFVYISTAKYSNDECILFDNDENDSNYKTRLVIGFLVFIAAAASLIFAVKMERDKEKKLFLIFISAYLLMFFLLLIPISSEMSMRMFLANFFFVFIFLGVVFEELIRRFKKIGVVLVIGMIIILSYFNLTTFKKAYGALSDYNTDDSEYFGGISYGELKDITSYIKNECKNSCNKEIYLIEFEYSESLEYVLNKNNISVETIDEEEKAPRGATVYDIDRGKSRENIKKSQERRSAPAGYKIEEKQIFGRYVIYKLK